MEAIPPIPNEAIAFLLPSLIEIVNKKVEDANGEPLTEADRTVVSFFVCFLVMLVLNWQAIKVGDVQQALTSFGTIFTISYAVFKLYWKNSYFRARMQEKYYGNPNEEETREPETMGEKN